MMGLIRLGGARIIDELKTGAKKISELKSSVPLYGSAFDFVLSYLMLYGLVRRYYKDGEEYLELTDIGKNLAVYGPMYIGLYRRRRWW
ncbi:hypothetical protein SJAV_09600 [Sulfurisphaera javensis]|uniref:Uncharacterized protein n=1 Tax=Sulfurisphaera javensis TaxID=2049879 RepID=A0AAT9GQD4_9CREN